MAVMMTSEVEGQTPEGYAAVLNLVVEAMKRSPGFLVHTAEATETGCRVVEVWESREHAAQFYTKHVVPGLTHGIRPKLVFHPLYNVVTP